MQPYLKSVESTFAILYQDLLTLEILLQLLVSVHEQRHGPGLNSVLREGI